jgi:acetyltransferase-like isoleucine patch superfamily enzyme
MKYRQLTIEEQTQLVKQGCTATDWTKVEVVEGFMPEYVQNVAFSGEVRLGRFERVFVQPGGFEVHSGVYYARLHNVTIGDNCYIDRIHNYIANYEIGNDVFIENTNLIVVDGTTTFGNGVRVPVMNETGGREVPIYDNLSAHLAYILTLYRHERELIIELERLIADYVEKQQREVGKIGNNVCIGANAIVIGKITIGDNCVIAPGAFVNQDMPSNTIAIGNPASFHHKENASDSLIVYKLVVE